MKMMYIAGDGDNYNDYDEGDDDDDNGGDDDDDDDVLTEIVTARSRGESVQLHLLRAVYYPRLFLHSEPVHRCHHRQFQLAEEEGKVDLSVNPSLFPLLSLSLSLSLSLPSLVLTSSSLSLLSPVSACLPLPLCLPLVWCCCLLLTVSVLLGNDLSFYFFHPSESVAS